MGISYRALGSAGEIGDSCHGLRMDGTSVLLDAGVHPRREGLDSLPRFDLVKDEDIEAILISHCHLDHLGALPVALRWFPHARVFMPDASATLAPVMLGHTVKVMQRLQVEEGIVDYPLYTQDDVDAVSYVFQGVREGRPFRIYSHLSGAADIEAQFYDAGHILGAAGIHLRSPSGSVFYTGDTSAHDQELVPRALYPEGPVDTLITECTLAADDEADRRRRKDETRRLCRAITDVVEADGSVLIPAFSLGRTQEMLAMLCRLREEGNVPDVDIYTAGFGGIVSDIYDRTRDRSRRRDAGLVLRDLDVLSLPQDVARGRHLRQPSLTVVSSGMMAPGTMSFRMAERMLPRPRHGIFFVGYVDPTMPGHRVLSARKGQSLRLHPLAPEVEVACRVDRFYFSAHSSRRHLVRLVDRLSPKNLLLVHGEPEAAAWMRDAVARRCPETRIVLPGQGEVIALD